jgi:hypothetical protein
MTITSARKSNFGTFPNKTISILAGATTALPTFAAQRFSDLGTGKLAFTLSSVTSITVAAVRPGQYYQEA